MAIGWDPNSDEMKGGGQSAAPGKAHVVVESFSEYASRGDHVVEFEVVAHDRPDQIGVIHKEYFSSSSKAIWRLRTLCVATGVHTAEEFARAKEEGRGFDMNTDATVGRQLYIELQEKEHNGNWQVKIDGRMFAVNDPKCRDWPTQPGILKRAGIPTPAVPAAGSAGTAAASAPAPAGGDPLFGSF